MQRSLIPWQRLRNVVKKNPYGVKCFEGVTFFTCTDTYNSMEHLFSFMDVLNAVIYIHNFFLLSLPFSVNGVSLNMFKVCAVFTWFFSRVDESITCTENYMHRRFSTIIPTLQPSHEWFIAYKFFSLIVHVLNLFLPRYQASQWIWTRSSTLMFIRMRLNIYCFYWCFTWTCVTRARNSTVFPAIWIATPTHGSVSLL